MLLKKDKIVKYLNLASDVWETYDEFAIKRNSKKVSNILTTDITCDKVN